MVILFTIYTVSVRFAPASFKTVVDSNTEKTAEAVFCVYCFNVIIVLQAEHFQG